MCAETFVMITLIFFCKGENKMTLEQAGKRFGVSVHTLEKYVSYGFIKQIKTNGISAIYNDTDFEQLGLIDTLLSTGFTPEETKKYLC